jgi:type IX secretion system PorP/SprF family membrane protein
MIMKNLYLAFITAAILSLAITLKAQDAHLSQYASSPVLLNPALTGIIPKGDMRIAANYRSQWGSVGTGSYTTTGIAFDMPFKNRWGVGGYATNNDLAGFMNAFNFMLSGSYLITEPGQSKYKIVTGLQAGIMLKQLDRQELVFDSQYENGNFEEDNPSGENFQNNSNFKPDFNWGISYIHTDQSWKVLPYLGVSAFHLSIPKEDFMGGEADNLPIRWVFNGGGKYSINEKLNINLRGLFMMQRKAKEINFGVLSYYKINTSEYTLLGGADVRWNDALIFNLGLKHKNITYRLSYDYNTSSLHNTSDGRGGTEISILYTPRNLRNAPKVN